jgi:RNA polymerase sigma-70 factor (ECF subfamily)
MDVEAEFARLKAGGNLKEAATLVVEIYGPEVLGFLTSVLRDEADSRDAFAQACEDLWKGLPRFEGRAQAKTWFYALARHAASRLRRTPHRTRQVPLSEVSEIAELVRSRTAPHLQSAVKVGVAAIREALNESDRALLILRVDRGMSWNDIARVMADDEHEAEPALARAAARLRKRFQSVKETIRERARAAGLVKLGADKKRDPFEDG